MSDNAELRKRLEEFYKKHAPQDIAKVDAALKVKATEEELFKKLYKKYNLNDKAAPIFEPQYTHHKPTTPTVDNHHAPAPL
jgi:hypothetical protein